MFSVTAVCNWAQKWNPGDDDYLAGREPPLPPPPPAAGLGLWLHRRPAGRHHRPRQAALARQPDQTTVLHAALLLLRLLRPLLVHQAEVIGGPGRLTCRFHQPVARRSWILKKIRLTHVTARKEEKPDFFLFDFFSFLEVFDTLDIFFFFFSSKAPNWAGRMGN